MSPTRTFRERLDGTRERMLAVSWDVVRAGYEFVYPSVCPLCGADEPGGDAHSTVPPLCATCQIAILPPEDRSCAKCAAPVGPHLDTSRGCVHCRDAAFRFERAYCAGVYGDVLRSACLQAKAAAGAGLAAALAEVLFSRHGAALVAESADCVVPVPQHWSRRLFGQGHHAAETIAATLARLLKADHVPSILKKIRRTPDQATLPATRRRTNLRGAFRTRAAVGLTGATVLLVDDILTTGSTANESAKALLAGGAGRVVVAVVARSLVH